MSDPRLFKYYNESIKTELQSRLGLENVMEIPRLTKIVLNMGVSSSLDKSALDDAAHDLQSITGRKPVTTLARKSIAGFKLREGQPVGCRVTLRRQVMWEFLDRLIQAALPRIRDFRGISVKSFDGRGNYSLGISDQSIFPEIELDKVKRTQGMDITFVTTANSDAAAKELLTLLGMPFVKKDKEG